MRLTDILEKPVFDETGREVAHVQDVRLVQDGPLLGTWGAALAIEGLIVGRKKLGERFGFHRTNMHGPWPLKAFFELYHRGARFVPWEHVTRFEKGRVEIRGRLDEFDPVRPISE